MPLSLEAENLFLREQLQTLRERAVEVEALFYRHQNWELELLTASSLSELLVCLTVGICSHFDVDVARLLLNDTEHSLRALLMHDDYHLTSVSEVIFFDEEKLPLVLKHMFMPWVGPLDAQGLPPIFIPDDLIRSIAIVPLCRQSRRLGFLGIGSRDPARYSPDLETHFLRRMGVIAAVCLENAVNRTRLEIGSLTDVLTGLYNRRALEQRLRNEIARACRAHQPLSCLFMDIDFFKQINDNYGHDRGDATLMQIAERLKSTLRASDVAVRFGGDELLVLLPATDRWAALSLAQRVRDVIKKQPFDLGNEVVLSLTVSIGIATIDSIQPNESFTTVGQELLKAADAALYAAKNEGRDRVATTALLAR